MQSKRYGSAARGPARRGCSRAKRLSFSRFHSSLLSRQEAMDSMSSCFHPSQRVGVIARRSDASETWTHLIEQYTCDFPTQPPRPAGVDLSACFIHTAVVLLLVSLPLYGSNGNEARCAVSGLFRRQPARLRQSSFFNLSLSRFEQSSALCIWLRQAAFAPISLPAVSAIRIYGVKTP